MKLLTAVDAVLHHNSCNMYERAADSQSRARPELVNGSNNNYRRKPLESHRLYDNHERACVCFSGSQVTDGLSVTFTLSKALQSRAVFSGAEQQPGRWAQNGLLSFPAGISTTTVRSKENYMYYSLRNKQKRTA